MGPLTLPAHGAIYLDTSAIIYSVERNEPYFTLLALAWQQAETGQFVVVSSALVISETLVSPNPPKGYRGGGQTRDEGLVIGLARV